jgi:hypothetical protein
MMREVLSLKSIRRRHGRLVRVIAVFFLIYTGADIMLPQYFCGGEEIGNLSLQTKIATTDASKVRENADAFIRSSERSHRDQLPNREAPHEEDCFCCCVHILPGLSFANIGDSELKSPRTPAETDRLPSPPLQSTYHPPRFA